jgi:hypothetical protein
MPTQRKVTSQQLKEELKDKDDAMFDFACLDKTPVPFTEQNLNWH